MLIRGFFISNNFTNFEVLNFIRKIFTFTGEALSVPMTRVPDGRIKAKQHSGLRHWRKQHNDSSSTC